MPAPPRPVASISVHGSLFLGCCRCPCFPPQNPVLPCAQAPAGGHPRQAEMSYHCWTPFACLSPTESTLYAFCAQNLAVRLLTLARQRLRTLPSLPFVERKERQRYHLRGPRRPQPITLDPGKFPHQHIYRWLREQSRLAWDVQGLLKIGLLRGCNNSVRWIAFRRNHRHCRCQISNGTTAAP